MEHLFERVYRETREDAYGIDLDYILDFIEYCNHGRASMMCWDSMADKWIEKYQAKVDPVKLVVAAKKFVKEQETR
jgi:hypothetical protein